MTKLTILIPTRNRRERIEFQANTILDKIKSHERSIQVVISDNSDVPLARANIDSRIEIIRASKRFHTFEEHFFWAIKKVDSEFVWVLGDDDEPLSETIDHLMKHLFENDHDIIMFNGLRETKNRNPSQIIPCSDNQIQMSYRQFLIAAGIWGVGAGISLCVFRRSFIKEKYLSEIIKIKSPIYSHVTLFLRSFKKGKFIFLNLPLVSYRRSDPEAQLKRSENWEKYSASTQKFYRYPWTVGFLKQIDYLVSTKSFSLSDLNRVLEFDVDGNRYFLVDSVGMMLLDEIENTFFAGKGKKNRMSKSDIRYLSSTAFGPRVLDPELIALVQALELDDSRQTKERIDQFRSIKSHTHSRLNNYEKRFASKKYADYVEFNTINGILQINNRLNPLNNLILNLACSVIGAGHISKLPNLNDDSPPRLFKKNVLNDFKLLVYLLRQRSGRRFIEERVYIHLRGIYVRSRLRDKPSLNLVRLQGKPSLNLRFFVHRGSWKIVSFLWMRMPVVFRKFLKNSLRR